MVYTLTLAEPAEIKTKAFIDDRWQNSAVYHFHGVVYYKNIERKTEYKNFWPKKTELINLYYIVIMIITISVTKDCKEKSKHLTMNRYYIETF